MPEILPQLFTMFFQNDEPSKDGEDRPRRGLALAKALVEMHGGVIEAYSEGKNKGAEFTVRLPMSASASEERCHLKPEECWSLTTTPTTLKSWPIYSSCAATK